jgi:transcriptional regulator with XRE-family HTH domain
MDQHLAALILSDPTSVPNGFALRLVNACSLAISRSFDGPPIGMGNDVLIFTGHFAFPCNFDTPLREANGKKEISYVECNCKMATVTTAHFDGERFVAALDSTRQARGLTWRKVADQADVSASTLTRMAQGKRPDVDSLAALSRWAGLKADDFFADADRAPSPEPLAQVTAYLRADPNLSETGKNALEAILHAAYDKLRTE